MEKVWGFAHELAAVDYNLKQAKVFVRLWSLLTFLAVMLIAVTLIAPGPIRWWSLGFQVLTLAADAMFLRVSLHRLARARARQERTEWAAHMHEVWSR